MDRTLVILKPDAVYRGLAGEITARFERKGLYLVACKMVMLEPSLLQEHYAHLIDRPFFPEIVAYMTSGPVMIQCWEGDDAVGVVRAMVGETDGRRAARGTIRGDYSMSMQANLVHASEDAKAAKVELERFFASGEILQYSHPLAATIY